ncbi:MAG TPA: alpha-2-macroglobulin, partial [bacterium]|nr:alpha-2-macroglobulin [bacterium]
MFRSRIWLAAAIVSAAVAGTLFFTAIAFGQKTLLPDRQRAEKFMKEGNFKEALDIYTTLALNPKNDPLKTGEDMSGAILCLQRLGRVGEFDEFVEKTIKNHTGNWRVLARAARYYMDIEHYGSMIAGQFVRGAHRGASAVVNSFERDRVRAMQLYLAALEKNTKDKESGNDSNQPGYLYLEYSRALMGNRGWSEAWRLQYLTDLSVLPDYEEGYYYWDYHSGTRGAPVNPDGTPVFHRMPKNWESATTDGERFRWCMSQAIEYSPSLKISVLSEWADFLCNQFGVATMSQYRGYFNRTAEDDTKKNESGPYAVHTLEENETIARLATGIKRFKLPDEFNYIKIYRQIADQDKNTGHGQQSLYRLADIFENRMQYVKAAECWRRSIREYGDAGKDKQERLDRIVKNWG